jgi:hypothetical protein
VGGWVAPRIFKDERIVKITEILISFVRLIDQVCTTCNAHRTSV